MSAPTRLPLRLLRASNRVTKAASRARATTAVVIQARLQPTAPIRRREYATLPSNDENGNIAAKKSSQPQQDSVPAQAQGQQVGRNRQLAETLAQADSSDLITGVRIPDDPHGVLPPDHPAFSILGNSSLVIQRQIEMMNVMLGFEQANRYIIMDGQGQTLGYIAEQDHGIGRTMARQLFRAHRSFTTHIFDAEEQEVLRIHRPFAYISSRIRIYDPVPENGYSDTDTSMALQGTSASSVMNQGAVAQVSPLTLEEMRIIGEAQQQWAPLRRKYNLFSYRPLEPPPEDSQQQRIESGENPASDTTALTEAKAPDQAIEAGMAQFAHVDEPFLSWDFTLRDAEQGTIGSVNRNFVGFAREIFTDTGVYALRMDSAAQTSSLESTDGTELQRYEKDATAMSLDQRAVMLATAVSIDFDFFSRHSRAGGHGFMPLWFPMGGGAAEGGAAGAGAGAAGEAGAIGAGGAAAGEAGAVGVAEGTAAVGSAAGRGLSTGGGAVGESGIAGAGTMAGYEAMQRGVYGSRGADDASPQAAEPFEGAGGQSPEQTENRPGDDVWGEGQDPWGGGDGGSTPTGGEGGGGIADWISDFFDS